MENLLNLIEPILFRVDAAGAITALNKSARVLLDPVTGADIARLFGCATVEELRAAASREESRVHGVRVGSDDRHVKWSFVAAGPDTSDVLVTGIHWTSAGELVDQLMKETLLYKGLVLNIVPRFLVDELVERKVVQPKAYRNATIALFQVMGFSDGALAHDPVALLRRLDRYFSAFDAVSAEYGLEKIRTTGDAYMAVSGIPHRRPSHGVDAVLGSLHVARRVELHRAADPTMNWQVRIGVHSGPCITGLVGASKYMFDVWGHTVDVAQDVRRASEPGVVTISATTKALVDAFFVCEPAGAVTTRGVGGTDLFIVRQLRPELCSDSAGLVPNRAFVNRYNEAFAANAVQISIAPPPYASDNRLT